MSEGDLRIEFFKQMFGGFWVTQGIWVAAELGLRIYSPPALVRWKNWLRRLARTDRRRHFRSRHVTEILLDPIG